MMIPHNTHPSDGLLRRSLMANAVFSMMAGVVAIAFSAPIAEFMGVARAVLVLVGAGVLGFGIATLWNARRSRIDLRLARMTVLSDLLWVVGAAVLIFGFPTVLTAGGKALLGVVSALVGLFGLAQWLGIRRLSGPKRLVTEVEIQADPEEVWAVLTDLDGYQDWNPFIIEGVGEVAVGNGLQLRMRPPGGKAATFNPIVTEANPSAAFEWIGRVGMPGIFDARHRFDLRPTPNGTKVTHSEEFSGILVPMMAKTLDVKAKAGFEAMNAAMKERVEVSRHLG